MTEQAKKKDESVKRNIYGVLPCPKCRSVYRYPTQDNRIMCGDCGTDSTCHKVAGSEWEFDDD